MSLDKLIATNVKSKKRVGRGIGSGRGKTAGRGTKGQSSRSGGGVRVGFEGGQNPITKRLPHLKGFKSRAPKNQVVNLSDLNVFTGKVTKEKLLEKGLIENIKLPVKILGNGKIEKVVEVSVEYVSKTAEAAITKNGGKVNILATRKSTEQKKKQTTENKIEEKQNDEEKAK